MIYIIVVYKTFTFENNNTMKDVLLDEKLVHIRTRLLDAIVTDRMPCCDSEKIYLIVIIATNVDNVLPVNYNCCLNRWHITSTNIIQC